MSDLLKKPLHVFNIGLDRFLDPLLALGVPVEECNWRPPAGGDADLAWQLALLTQHPDIEKANDIAFQRYLTASPVLEGVGTAGQTIPDFSGHMLLHSGPPIAWEDMCGPQQGALIGATLLEGWASTPAQATRMLESGSIMLDACHHHQAVGPMAGVISPSMPVWIVRNTQGNNTAYCNFNEGLGKVLRFGAYDDGVLTRLRWMNHVLAPLLAETCRRLGPLEIKPLMAQALGMGDEVHNRNAAATALLFRVLVPIMLDVMADIEVPAAQMRDALAFIAGNEHFFLNISMAACKSMLDAAHGVPNSSLVTAMARNGVNFGIRVSGLGSRWFEAPAPYVEGLFFPGYGPDDAAPDLGDSAITETAGLGGFAMAAAPAIVQFVGGTVADARLNSRRMTHITHGVNPAFTLPMLNFAPTAAGIDIRKVADTSTLPIINTGIAHKKAGIGQVGAGLTYAPMPCFLQALKALSVELEGKYQ